ncbi:hypothetical protein [Planobispora takensis]|uniref:Methyltransferase domain-containing protein n=1 Tax=Planobispora takensis TaxID=1367882 RepID=A0A8J3SZ22_9ACTN|nr:hypothetical protein [Planobispora takensis]GII01426.1 hypothetical protein Pta02_34340 [Planobispora takensis]
MTPAAAYDEIADWYENDFLGGWRAHEETGGDPLGVGPVLRDLLGAGGGPCLEIGCGTGFHAAGVRALGWRPVGVGLLDGPGGAGQGRRRAPAPAGADALLP